MGKLAKAALAASLVSNAAYTLVDLSGLDPEDRKAIENDAANGGRTYGVRVVEEAVFGGARSPLYGVYKDGPDAERWAAAKKEYGLGSTEVEDASVLPGGLGVDPRREAALREAAAQRAAAEADAIRAGEEAAIREITGESGDDTHAGHSTADARARMEPTANIVDTTLSQDASNEAANAGPADEADKDGNTQEQPRSTRRSRTPR